MRNEKGKKVCVRGKDEGKQTKPNLVNLAKPSVPCARAPEHAKKVGYSSPLSTPLVLLNVNI